MHIPHIHGTPRPVCKRNFIKIGIYLPITHHRNILIQIKSDHLRFRIPAVDRKSDKKSHINGAGILGMADSREFPVIPEREFPVALIVSALQFFGS